MFNIQFSGDLGEQCKRVECLLAQQVDIEYPGLVVRVGIEEAGTCRAGWNRTLEAHVIKMMVYPVVGLVGKFPVEGPGDFQG